MILKNRKILISSTFIPVCPSASLIYWHSLQFTTSQFLVMLQFNLVCCSQLLTGQHSSYVPRFLIFEQRKLPKYHKQAILWGLSKRTVEVVLPSMEQTLPSSNCLISKPAYKSRFVILPRWRDRMNTWYDVYSSDILICNNYTKGTVEILLLFIMGKFHIASVMGVKIVLASRCSPPLL